MEYLLRKFSLSKWEPNRGVTSEEITADAITGCTRTSNNTLSVWSSTTQNFTCEEVERLIVALATTMNEPAAIDLIWLDDEWLRLNGIQLVESEGQSKYKSVNCKHKDLSFLNHSSLALIGEHIISQMNDETKYKRVTKKELIRLVAKWMKADNEFGLGELKEKWHEPIHKISN
ncbi:hypothetical protein ACM36E_000933 [Cronobacter sakazakii]|uniref:hypothetical protein n=1 Tax=Cronobacter sakazakii TaxID=28141 RepID=UPI000CFD475C|nr:hypothetical protein [Cronobacter sakazakii]NCI18431.1 hypothetical protein [Cronobacter muytjensii]ELY2794051.1 hypothetical protein [Cronobacter sakazakii]ELY3449929.1 hypothetical protein [Cronobacter sakazakii]ELY4372405.1 hypothetical protein [Cronobacter sakazakii]ELY4593098.1 hypothetical protein [Cronobacter sakazakii]